MVECILITALFLSAIWSEYKLYVPFSWTRPKNENMGVKSYLRFELIYLNQSYESDAITSLFCTNKDSIELEISEEHWHRSWIRH